MTTADDVYLMVYSSRHREIGGCAAENALAQLIYFGVMAGQYLVANYVRGCASEWCSCRHSLGVPSTSRALFSFIIGSTSCSRSRRTAGRNPSSPKDPGGIDESIDLSRDR
jgi:hypothetical protein